MKVETKKFICIKDFYIYKEGEIYELEIIDCAEWLKPDVWDNEENVRIIWEKFLECFREVKNDEG